MVRTVEIAYAEAKRNRLYLPPIDDVTGAVVRDFYDSELHFPAGYVGQQKVKYAPHESDSDLRYAYKKKGAL